MIFNVKNGIPLRAQLTLEFFDILGKPITLPAGFKTTYSIEAGKVDSNGYVQAGDEAQQIMSMTFTKDQLDVVRKARALIYTVRVEGKDAASPIHITVKNTFSMKVGLYVKGVLK